MIVAVRTRQQFEQIVRDGSRIRCAQLWCTWCPDLGSQHTSIGYSITRAVGPAVVRNRLRRRLRVILNRIDQEDPLPSALLILGARPEASELTFAQLNTLVIELTTRLRTQFTAQTAAVVASKP